MSKKNRKKIGRFEVPRLKNACDTLLANIRFASVEERVKTLVVTSSGVDEGKSTVSSNLACVMASSGKRVLIVDADMRRRCLGTMLDVHPRYGLHAVLTGEVSVNEAITPTSIRGIYFLDTEPNIPNPTDLLSSRRFAALVDALRGVFDYVIFDTPPLGAFVDAALAGNVVDGVVFVVRERVTNRAVAKQCLAQLEAANARVLGIVRTFAQEAERDSYYYAYYNEDGTRAPNPKNKPASSAPSLEIDGDFDAWVAHMGVSPYGVHSRANSVDSKTSLRTGEGDSESEKIQKAAYQRRRVR